MMKCGGYWLSLYGHYTQNIQYTDFEEYDLPIRISKHNKKVHFMYANWYTSRL